MLTKNEHNCCILCGSKEIRSLKKYVENYLYQCHNCNFVFCKKIPSLEELAKHYGDYPRHDDISIITIKRFEEIIDGYKSVRKTNRILDVGCGNGHLLKVAKQKGWEVHGTEYTTEAINICTLKGIEMVQGPLDVSNYEEASFDIIFFIEVIEHINTPVEVLQDMCKLLRVGGILYITTPNFNSLSRYLLKDKWNVVEYMEHLCYYTKTTLNMALINSGFRKLNLQTTGFSVNRFKKSSNYILQSESPKEITDEKLRELTETKKVFIYAKILINLFLNIFSCGDTLKALYEKR